MILLLAASSSDWTPTVLPIIGVVIGAAIGAVAAVGGGAFAQWFTRQLERQSLAAALAGEVEAVKAIVEFRRYRQLIQSFIDQTRAANKVVYLRVLIDDHPFPAFEENISKIGFLPADLARQVTKFYTYARSSVLDFRTLYSDNLSTWPLPVPVGFMEEMIRSMDTSEKLANDLIPKLRKEAARPWYHYLQPTE